jgi:hypothetical protein
MTHPRHSEIQEEKKCEVEHDQIDARSGDRIGARGGLFSTWQSAINWRRRPVAGRDDAAGFCRNPGYAACRPGWSGAARQRAACDQRDFVAGCGSAHRHIACGGGTGDDTGSCARNAASGSASRAATAAGTQVP